MTTIKLKNGSGAPLAGDLVQGEPALDLTNKRLYTEDSGGTVIEVGTNPSELTVTGDLAVDTNTLFVDASADAVGIGTASPEERLDVRGNIQIDASSAIGTDILSTVSAIPAARNHGYVATASSAAGGANGDLLIAPRTSAGANVRFITGTSPTERMRIDASGNVGIGTSTPGHVLTVRASSATNLAEIRNIDGGDNHGLTITDGSGVVELAAVYSSSAPDMTFKVGNSERIRIDSSGNVGIGTSSPAYKLSVHADAVGTTYPLKIENGNTTSGNGVALLFTHRAHGGDNQGSIEYVGAGANNTNSMLFKTEASGVNGMAERMRIDSSGNLLVGTTSQINDEALSVDAGNTRAFQVRTAQTAPGGVVIQARTAVGGTGTTVFIVRSDGDLENTNNSYGAISDARLKSDIVDASSQIDDIMAVKVRSYTLNSTGDKHIGVIAQELEEVGMDGLVKTDEEGMKSVKYSVLYMKAIKAIQEQQAMIEDLKAEVAALKGA